MSNRNYVLYIVGILLLFVGFGFAPEYPWTIFAFSTPGIILIFVAAFLSRNKRND